MLKQAQLIGTTIILVAATTAGATYLWWQSTPQFALIEARKGYLEQDSRKFNKYVDVATLTNAFTEEIIFAPADMTPNLSRLQRVIGLGALHAARTKIDNSLIFQIQKLVRKQPNGGEKGSSDDNGSAANSKAKQETDVGLQSGKSADNASTGDATVAGADGTRDEHYAQPRKLSGVLRIQWKKEKARLKKATFERMSEFAKQHPDTLINRIFAAPAGGRANAVKEILAECGFKASNFKKYRLEKKGTRCIAHLTFLSPRINDLVTVKLEMERIHQGPFGRYRIFRLVDFKGTLDHLNYHTDRQIQGLVAYGLQDLSGQTLAGKAKEVLKNIGEAAAKMDDDDDTYDDGDADNDGIVDVKPIPFNKRGESRTGVGQL